MVIQYLSGVYSMDFSVFNLVNLGEASLRLWVLLGFVAFNIPLLLVCTSLAHVIADIVLSFLVQGFEFYVELSSAITFMFLSLFLTFQILRHHIIYFRGREVLRNNLSNSLTSLLLLE